MTLNFIRWWGSNSENLGSVEYPLVEITPGPSLTVLVRVPSMGQTSLIENYLYSIEMYAKKSLKKQQQKI